MFPQVPRANLPVAAAAIDALVVDPLMVLGNALFVWTAATGWR